MSQLSLNQTIQSRVTDPESAQKRGIFKNPENHSKKRPSSAIPSKFGNDDNTSIGTGGGGGGDFTKNRKLGILPSYLKKQTRSSVESDLFTKHKKFKIAKRELVEKQTNLMKDFQQLLTLKDKFKQLGGRDFKLETLELLDFNDYVDNGCGDGIRNIRIGNASDGIFDGASIMHEFQQEIQRIRGRVKDCLFNLIKLNGDAFKHIQAFGSEELEQKVQEIFSKVEDYVKSANSEQDIGMEFLLEKLNQFRTPTVSETTNRLENEEEMVRLREVIQNLEVQSKMLHSEIDVKNKEIEYLKKKESSQNKTNADNCGVGRSSYSDQQELLHSQILSDRETVDDYRHKLNEQSKLQEMMADKMKQLEDTIIQQDHQMKANQLQFENDLNLERKKYEGLEQMLDEMRDTNSKFLEENGSNYEQISNELVSATEDIKELQFKIAKRDKQIQGLKQIVNAESNKVKDYDQLLLKYEEIRQQDQQRTKEMLQLKEKLVARSDTINSQMLTITDLKKQLMDRSGAAGAKDTVALHDEQMSKFLDHERIIKKLENNKIRSNMLRDQLLGRISMLEKENDDMKGQIRKFHEDFTINRFMYDEQRRKKRLTEILVKQYQK